MYNTIKEHLFYLTPYRPKIKRLGDKEYIYSKKNEGYTNNQYGTKEGGT